MDELGKGDAAHVAYEVLRDGDAPMLKLAGELDITTADQLEAAVAQVIASSPERLVIDASGLSFADSSAIALFVKWSSIVGAVELRDPSPLLRRVIERMGLGQRLHVTP